MTVLIMCGIFCMFWAWWRIACLIMNRLNERSAADDIARQNYLCDELHIDLPTPPASSQEVALENLEVKKEFKCPICNVSVEKDAEVVICSRCETPAHKDCFEFNGKCGVFACGNKTSTPMICGPCEARHRDEQDPFRAYDALTYDYDYLRWRKSCPHYK